MIYKFIIWRLNNYYHMTQIIVDAKPDRKSLPTRGVKGSPAVWIE